jgi:hypothetical protein
MSSSASKKPPDPGNPGGETAPLVSLPGMRDTTQHPDDFATAFDRAFARLQVRVETACAAEPEWQLQVAAAVRAALAFAAHDPRGARVLTSDALAAGREGYARYDRMLAHFGERLLPGRGMRPEGEYLPEITEKAMTGGIATIVANRVDTRRERELPALAAEATQFVLTPYLGTEEARRIAAEAS